MSRWSEHVDQAGVPAAWQGRIARILRLAGFV